jgi:hypothetical protein
MAAAVRFEAEVLSSGKSATGIEVPAEAVAALGSGKRPAVRATINGYTYRNTVAVMGGRSLLSVSADVRQRAGIAAGDRVVVELDLDTDPREVEVPADLAAALAADPRAQAFFATLSYSKQLRHVLAIEAAKAAETRQRRVEKSVALFHEHRDA